MNAKEAVQRAVQYATELLEDEIADVRLEELNRTASTWEVTLSWVRARGPGGMPTGLLGQLSTTAKPRVYREFIIDDETGEFKSMFRRGRGND